MNRLQFETSPYLLQHKDNPVDWHPWGKEAFEQAKAENKPILLSIGYAACHWCHVMAHESFEDTDTAAVMNELYINIKVDREERPDVDKIYMDAIHALGEQGGWPLTMFLNTAGEPFWGGTYFPPQAKFGRPGFRDILRQISGIWHDEADKVHANAQALRQALDQRIAAQPTDERFGPHLLEQAKEVILRATDFSRGGLNGAPKFPQCPMYQLLWNEHLKKTDQRAAEAVTTTLTNICQGGIYDHLGGGFSRYSVDADWLAPHFEKMLYDNAALIDLLSLVWVSTANNLFRIRIEEVVNWLKAEMMSDKATFYASLDADSEGEEGKFYVWAEEEINGILAEPFLSTFKQIYNVTPGGNWEGHTILNRLKAQSLLDEKTEKDLAHSREKLLAYRAHRIRPGTDTKILSDWNGQMIEALARAGARLNRPDWIDLAVQAFKAVFETNEHEGILWHSYCDGQRRGPATIDDYANLTAAALILYQLTAEKAYLSKAIELERKAVETHWNTDTGGFFFSSGGDEYLISRSYYAHDDATPNGNATFLRNYASLALLTGEDYYNQQADKLIAAFSANASRSPVGHTGLLNAFDAYQNNIQAVLLHDHDTETINQALQLVYRAPQPHLIFTAIAHNETLPANHPARDKTMIDGKPSLYLCRGQTCDLPLVGLEQIKAHFAKTALA